MKIGSAINQEVNQLDSALDKVTPSAIMRGFAKTGDFVAGRAGAVLMGATAGSAAFYGAINSFDRAIDAANAAPAHYQASLALGGWHPAISIAGDVAQVGAEALTGVLLGVTVLQAGTETYKVLRESGKSKA